MLYRCNVNNVTPLHAEVLKNGNTKVVGDNINNQQNIFLHYVVFKVIRYR